MSNFLVTGGAGFIGSNIVKRLVESGENVVVIDNLLTGKKKNIAEYLDRIKFYEASILDDEILDKALDGIDYVLHQAALPSVQRSVENPILTNDINISGTLKLLEKSRQKQIKKFVYASSSSVYGDSEVLPKREEFKLEPKSPYAIAKLTGEYYTVVYNQMFNLKTVALRYFNVYGPNQDPNSYYSAVIPKFIKAVLRDERPVIFGDGLQARDFTFVEDVVSANITAALSEKTGVFNVAIGDMTNLLDLLEKICRILNKEISPEFQQARAGDVKFSKGSGERAKESLGFECVFDIEKGLKKTIEFYKKELGK